MNCLISSASDSVGIQDFIMSLVDIGFEPMA